MIRRKWLSNSRNSQSLHVPLSELSCGGLWKMRFTFYQCL